MVLLHTKNILHKITNLMPVQNLNGQYNQVQKNSAKKTVLLPNSQKSVCTVSLTNQNICEKQV